MVLLGLLFDLNQNQENYGLDSVLLAICDKLQEYWEHLDQITHIATFFDPRYKTIAFHGLSKDEILVPICSHLPTSISNLSNNNK